MKGDSAVEPEGPEENTSSGLRGVKNIIIVMSGKGGVGKSTVTVEIALTLRSMGKKVGILDIDLCGPSIPRMFGISNQRVHQSSYGYSVDHTRDVTSGACTEATSWRQLVTQDETDFRPKIRPRLFFQFVNTGFEDSFCLNEWKFRKGDRVVCLSRNDHQSYCNIQYLNKQWSLYLTKHMWVPVYPLVDKTVALMSIGFLMNNPDEAVVWRGPKKNSLIKQLLDGVYWDDIDYLLIDTPPGTSDEHITIVEALRQYNPEGAVLVTTPQAVSVADVRREITFCRKAALPILGVVENMSGFICPNCEECTNVFSSGGGKDLAEEYAIPYLGNIPIDPELTKSLEQGSNFIEKFPESKVATTLRTIVTNLVGNPE